MDRLKIIIESIVRDLLNEEGRFQQSQFPHNSRSHRERNVGNPIIGHGNGSHSNQDVTSQVSTVDDNGANFTSSDRHYCISDKNFLKYKSAHFDNTSIKSTMDFFGGNTENLRREIDLLNGAAKRNGKALYYRTITSKTNKKKSQMSGRMSNTFWEFSFDGINWYLLLPNAVEKMKKSKLVTQK